MLDSRIYARFVTIISDYPDKKEAVIEYTGRRGQVIRESIFKTTKEEQKFIR
jgi:hypothetical protein